jgi:hypothetical protein
MFPQRALQGGNGQVDPKRWRLPAAEPSDMERIRNQRIGESK